MLIYYHLCRHVETQNTDFELGEGCGRAERVKGRDEEETGHTRSRFNVCTLEASAEQGGQWGGVKQRRKKNHTKEGAELLPSYPRGSLELYRCWRPSGSSLASCPAHMAGRNKVNNGDGEKERDSLDKGKQSA